MMLGLGGVVACRTNRIPACHVSLHSSSVESTAFCVRPGMIYELINTNAHSADNISGGKVG